jgi:hypothetical protein
VPFADLPLPILGYPGGEPQTAVDDEKSPHGQLFTQLPTRGVLGSPHTASFLASPLCEQRIAYFPARIPGIAHHALWLSVQVHLDAQEGEGHAMGGDVALLQWGSVGFYVTLLSAHTPNIGECVTPSNQRAGSMPPA